MKFIEAIIRPNMYYKTKEKLAEQGFHSAFTYNVLGRGQKAAVYELVHDGTSSKTKLEFCSKKYIGIYAIDEDVDDIVDIIKKINSKGCHGDGKIFITNAYNAIRISTKESGEDAIV